MRPAPRSPGRHELPCYDYRGPREFLGLEGGFALHFDESGNFSAPAAFGTYRVLHQTGSGVLGPVFRAFDSPRDRLVAIKVFRLEILPEQVVRLADALRRLQSSPPVHPLIVPLLDVGLEGTTPYLVMSFQVGETLDMVLRRSAPMSMDQALRILRPLAATLTVSAEAGILHGGLHPRDVFLPDDQEALAGVTGFGIAQALEAADVATPALRRPYAAPERASGTWDVRADVFSLGVIAHELLTGRRPAPSGEQDGVFDKGMLPEHRVRLRRVLTTALADQPDQRFSSPDALISALHDDVHRTVSLPSKAAVVAPDSDAGLDAKPTEKNDPHEQREQEPDVEHIHASKQADEPADDVFLPEEPEEEEREDAQREDEQREDEQREDEEIEPVTPIAAAAARAAIIPRPREVIVPPAAVPAAAQAKEWLDTALTSKAYDIPSGVFDAPVVPPPKPARVVAKTVFFAAAGLLVGVSGGLWAAGRWFDSRQTSSAGSATMKIVTSVPVSPDATRRAPQIPAAPSVTEAPLPAPPVTRDRSEPAPAPDVQPAVATGRLVVRSQPPGALVTIDGRRFGETPVVARGLAPGTYDVVVAHPGHVPRTERVTIRASAPVRTLSVTLAPGLESTPSTVPTTTRGAIDVDSRPRGARVIVDGRFVGLSPLRLADVGPGEHQVTLELGGYRSATGRVRVEPGRTAELTTTLRASE